MDIDPVHQWTIFALWDSLTEWYGIDIKDAYPEQLENILLNKWYWYTVINWWKSWEISSWLLANLDQLIVESKPGDIAIVVIWANDGLRSLSLEVMEKNIGAIIEHLQKKNIQVILGWMKIPKSLITTYWKEFTKVYPILAKRYDIPLIPFFLQGVAGRSSLNLPDRMHPNKDGYDIIANNVARFLIRKWIVQQ